MQFNKIIGIIISTIPITLLIILLYTILSDQVPTTFQMSVLYIDLVLFSIYEDRQMNNIYINHIYMPSYIVHPYAP